MPYGASKMALERLGRRQEFVQWPRVADHQQAKEAPQRSP